MESKDGQRFLELMDEYEETRTYEEEEGEYESWEDFISRQPIPNNG